MRKAGVACVLLAALGVAPAGFAGDDFVYLHRHEGVRTYTDIKPHHARFARIRIAGRATASASCMGLSQSSLQERAARYAPVIQKAAGEHRLSPRIVNAVMRVESCYDPRAVSRAGARGLMQLMPMTAAQLGVNDSFDPEQNVSGGVRYLAQMMQRFNGNLRYALAAYNAGPEAVARHQGVPPYPETINYVRRITKLLETPDF
jgi:soluble lytic murein transglycosylase-like protein